MKRMSRLELAVARVLPGVLFELGCPAREIEAAQKRWEQIQEERRRRTPRENKLRPSPESGGQLLPVRLGNRTSKCKKHVVEDL